MKRNLQTLCNLSILLLLALLPSCMVVEDDDNDALAGRYSGTTTENDSSEGLFVLQISGEGSGFGGTWSADFNDNTKDVSGDIQNGNFDGTSLTAELKHGTSDCVWNRTTTLNAGQIIGSYAAAEECPSSRSGTDVLNKL